MKKFAVTMFLVFLIPPVLRINYPDGDEKLVAQHYQGTVWLELRQPDGHMAFVALDSLEADALVNLLANKASAEIQESVAVPDSVWNPKRESEQ